MADSKRINIRQVRELVAARSSLTLIVKLGKSKKYALSQIIARLRRKIAWAKDEIAAMETVLAIFQKDRDEL